MATRRIDHLMATGRFDCLTIPPGGSPAYSPTLEEVLEHEDGLAWIKTMILHAPRELAFVLNMDNPIQSRQSPC